MTKKTEIVINDALTRSRVVEFIQNLAPDKPWHVTIQHHRKKRSNPQNRTWHGWFKIIAEETGDTEESVKKDLTEMFTPLVENKFKAGEFRHKTTSELDTAEGAEFQNRVYQLAAQYNIWLPHPDDKGR